MTPEPDPISKIINESPKGPLGFTENTDEVQSRQTMEVGTVKGRRIKIKIKGGEKGIPGKTRVVVGPRGLKYVEGNSDAPVRVDDLDKVMEAGSIAQAVEAISKNRQERKENLRGK